MDHPTAHTSAPTNVLNLLDFCIFLAALPAGCDCSEGVKLWHSPQSPAYTHTHSNTHTPTHTRTPSWTSNLVATACALAAPLASVRLRVHKLSNSIAFRTALLLLPPPPSAPPTHPCCCCCYLWVWLGNAHCHQRQRHRASETERAWRNHTPRLIYCALSNYP